MADLGLCERGEATEGEVKGRERGCEGGRYIEREGGGRTKHTWVGSVCCCCCCCCCCCLSIIRDGGLDVVFDSIRDIGREPGREDPGREVMAGRLGAMVAAVLARLCLE